MASADFDSLLKNIEIEQRDPQPLKESDVQALVFKYLENRDLDSHPSLSGIKAKSWGQIRFMKKQGIRKGHPDLMIEEPAGKYQIFYLELKKIGGKLDEYQIAWLKRHIAKGHACSVSYGYYDAYNMGGEMRVRGKKNTLAKLLLKHRIDNDLKCEDMAKMLGMTKQQYNRYEHSNALPLLYNIKKLANVINVEEKELYKILMKTDKKAIQTRCMSVLGNRNINDDDLLTIVMILQKYYKPKARKIIKE